MVAAEPAACVAVSNTFCTSGSSVEKSASVSLVERIDSSSTTRFSSRLFFSMRESDCRICSGVNGLPM